MPAQPIRYQTGAYGAPAPIIDRNDCGVRALSVAACVPYATAHAARTKYGRKPQRGMYWSALLRAAAEVNAPPLAVFDLRPNRPTIAQFAAAHPTGHWLIFVAGHFLAIVDGVAHDWPGYAARRGSSRRRVKVAARVA